MLISKKISIPLIILSVVLIIGATVFGMVFVPKMTNEANALVYVNPTNYLMSYPSDNLLDYCYWGDYANDYYGVSSFPSLGLNGQYVSGSARGDNNFGLPASAVTYQNNSSFVVSPFVSGVTVNNSASYQYYFNDTLDVLAFKCRDSANYGNNFELGLQFNLGFNNTFGVSNIPQRFTFDCELINYSDSNGLIGISFLVQYFKEGVKVNTLDQYSVAICELQRTNEFISFNSGDDLVLACLVGDFRNISNSGYVSFASLRSCLILNTDTDYMPTSFDTVVVKVATIGTQYTTDYYSQMKPMAVGLHNGDSFNGYRTSSGSLWSISPQCLQRYLGDSNYNSGFDYGYDLGQSYGVESGYSLGYDDGYAMGAEDSFNDGYLFGYQSGLQMADDASWYNLISSIFNAPLEALFGKVDPINGHVSGGLFNLSIPLGGSTLNLRNFFIGILSCLLVVIVIRLVLRFIS